MFILFINWIFLYFYRAFHAAPAGASAAERLEPIISHIRNTLERTSAVTVGTASYGRLLKRAFESCDANGNGKLSEKEFMDAMKSLKVSVTTTPGILYCVLVYCHSISIVCE